MKEITLRTEREKPLSELLAENGILISQPCGGRGRCGKCKAKVAGSLSPASARERELLGNELNQGVRLTCMCKVYGEVTVRVPEETARGLLTGLMPEFTKNPLNGKRPCRALAVDIGTTTIAAYLCDLPGCEITEAVCVPNPQARFGADVISRIEYAANGGLDALRAAVSEALDGIAARFGNPELRIITGNTAMLHILDGLDPTPLATAPFVPKSLFGEWRGEIYLPRCISAFVGADITCAALASGLLGHKTALLMDIGTNGEIALWHEGRLHCCSAAAGPVFEGAGISMGSAAVSGAIDKVYLADGKLRYSVIGGVPAQSICGSGLLDAVAVMLDMEILEQSGYLAKSFAIGDSGVAITPEDIRQVQLAKAALRAALDTLLSAAGIGYEDIGRLYIAGGFGSFMDIHSAVRIGLIPVPLLDKAVAVGNAAGMGAALMLMSREALERSEAIAASAGTLELSSNPSFTERYIEEMIFPNSEVI